MTDVERKKGKKFVFIPLRGRTKDKEERMKKKIEEKLEDMGLWESEELPFPWKRDEKKEGMYISGREFGIIDRTSVSDFRHFLNVIALPNNFRVEVCEEDEI